MMLSLGLAAAAMIAVDESRLSAVDVWRARNIAAQAIRSSRPITIASSCINFTADGMNVSLDATRQTFSSLCVAAKDVPGGCFDFIAPPSFGGSHRLGDVTLRVRVEGQTTFNTLTSAANPSAAVPLNTSGSEFAAADMTRTLDAPASIPLTLERHYVRATRGLTMSFRLRNTGKATLEVGAFGAAMIFFTKDTQGGGTRSLAELAGNASMIDPAIVGDHGWVSATRMTGTGQVLLVVPERGSSGGGVENWRRMREASGGVHFELTSLSKAWADNEWANSSTQFVPPSSLRLAAGAEATFSYRFLLAKSVRAKDDALADAGFAVVQAIPAYTIATDMTNASVHVRPPHGASLRGASAMPAGALSIGTAVPIGHNGFLSLPVKGLAAGRVSVALHFSDGSATTISYHVLPPFDEQLARYGRFASTTAWFSNATDPFGRAPCVLGYNRHLGKQIGFHGPGGYEDNRIFNNGLSDEAGAGANVGFAAKVSGAPLQAEVSKLDAYITETLYGVQKGLPFGASLQCVEGEAASEAPSCGPPSAVGPSADGVMASMFWVPTNLTTEEKMPGYDYDPRWFCNYGNQTCPPGWPGWLWDQARSASLGRAYNYPHQSSVYLALYLASANYDLLATRHAPRWYLTRAFETVVAMFYQASWYSHQGLMDGTNFRTILLALRDEGMDKEASVVEDIMRNRTLVGVVNKCRYYVPPGRPFAQAGDRGPSYPGCHWYLEQNRTTPWAQQAGLPGAGSEFAWDTTGQEEAYVWGAYFGGAGDASAAALAASALDQVLAYTPLVPNFAWHGSAFGFGDFGNNGCLPCVGAPPEAPPSCCQFDGGSERVLQHYRSGLNAIPTTEAFMADPADTYLLRLAAGSIGGVLANIDEGGAPSMGFHADPANLVFDPASGDWGLALFGHTHNTQAFLIHHDDFGWQCFFCDLLAASGTGVRTGSGATLTLMPRDSYRRRVFLAPLGLQIVSEAGTLAHVDCLLDGASNGTSIVGVRVAFSPVGAQPLSSFRLRLLTKAGRLRFRVAGGFPLERGAYVIAPPAGRPPRGAVVNVTWA